MSKEHKEYMKKTKRAVCESALSVIEGYLWDYETGTLTKEDIKKKIRAVLYILKGCN